MKVAVTPGLFVVFSPLEYIDQVPHVKCIAMRLFVLETESKLSALKFFERGFVTRLLNGTG